MDTICKACTNLLTTVKEMSLMTFFIILGMLILLYVLVYIIFRIRSHQRIITSHFIKDNQPFEADHFYFLPAYGLKIQATANILVEVNKESGKFSNPKLQELKVETQSILLPDTNSKISVHYKPDYFSNDEFKITTTSDYLLDNLITTSDDRIDEIITSIVSAPVEMVKSDFAEVTNIKTRVQEIVSGEKEYQIVTFSKLFEIFPEEMTDPEIEKEWEVYIEGKPVAAGFKLINTSYKSRSEQPIESYRGLFSRTLKREMWEVKTLINNSDIEFSVLVPDTSSLLKIPISRAYFVKKQHSPKFSNGLLVENIINKPSEAEAFVSIPISIAKAIVSIPAQLLKFNTNQNKLRIEYEKSIKGLSEALKVQNEDSITKISSEIKSIHSKIDSLVPPVTSRKPLINPGEKTPPLGKLPCENGYQSGSLNEILASVNHTGSTKLLLRELANEVDEGIRWDSKFNGDWLEYGNSILGGKESCVVAAAAHLRMAWTSNTREDVVILDSAEVEKVFKAKCTLKGCHIHVFLNYWNFKGFLSNLISTSASLPIKDRSEIKSAIGYFGPCMVGFDMPITAQKQTNSLDKEWKIVPEADPAEQVNGSWGGHAVAAIGYDMDNLFVISWGTLFKVNWEFYEKYNDESYAILTEEWINDKNESPMGVKFDDLQEIIKALQKKPLHDV